MKIPAELKYTKDHEWAQEQGGTITIGITDHAQSSLGDIVYLELPAKGRVLKKGETFGVVESIKAVSDLYSPIDGKVVDINEDLKNNPAQINSDPYQKSWMIKVEAGKAATGELMDSKAYEAYVKTLS